MIVHTRPLIICHFDLMYLRNEIDNIECIGFILGLKNQRIPQDRVKLFVLPFKEWKLFTPPPPIFNMVKTSSYRIKTIPKLAVPFRPPPLFVGVKLHMPPPPFLYPPSP